MQRPPGARNCGESARATRAGRESVRLVASIRHGGRELSKFLFRSQLTEGAGTRVENIGSILATSLGSHGSTETVTMAARATTATNLRLESGSLEPDVNSTINIRCLAGCIAAMQNPPSSILPGALVADSVIRLPPPGDGVFWDEQDNHRRNFRGYCVTLIMTPIRSSAPGQPRKGRISLCPSFWCRLCGRSLQGDQ